MLCSSVCVSLLSFCLLALRYHSGRERERAYLRRWPWGSALLENREKEGGLSKEEEAWRKVSRQRAAEMSCQMLADIWVDTQDSEA